MLVLLSPLLIFILGSLSLSLCASKQLVIQNHFNYKVLFIRYNIWHARNNLIFINIHKTSIQVSYDAASMIQIHASEVHFKNPRPWIVIDLLNGTVHHLLFWNWILMVMFSMIKRLMQVLWLETLTATLLLPLLNF